MIIEKSIELKASPARVWRALTDSQEFAQWFRAVIEGPFVLGQATTARSAYPGHEHFRFTIEVTRLEPETTFAFTWGPLDKTSTDPRLEVVFTLTPTAGGGTRLHLAESGFEKYPEDRQMLRFRENTQGWEIQAANIRAHVDAE